MDLSFPGTMFPAPPSLSLRCPYGWEPVLLANALVAARDTASPEGFDVNVVVVATRLVDDALGLDRLVDEMHARTVTDLGGTMQQTSTATLAKRDARLTAWLLEPAASPFPLFQVEAALLVASSNPRISHLVQLHGTAPAGYAEHYGAIFRAIFDTLAIA